MPFFLPGKLQTPNRHIPYRQLILSFRLPPQLDYPGTKSASVSFLSSRVMLGFVSQFIPGLCNHGTTTIGVVYEIVFIGAFLPYNLASVTKEFLTQSRHMARPVGAIEISGVSTPDVVRFAGSPFNQNLVIAHDGVGNCSRRCGWGSHRKQHDDVTTGKNIAGEIW